MKGYRRKVYKEILLEDHKPLLWITLNRPQYSNAFSDEMISELCDVHVRLIVSNTGRSQL